MHKIILSLSKQAGLFIVKMIIDVWSCQLRDTNITINQNVCLTRSDRTSFQFFIFNYNFEKVILDPTIPKQHSDNWLTPNHLRTNQKLTIEFEQTSRIKYSNYPFPNWGSNSTVSILKRCVATPSHHGWRTTRVVTRWESATRHIHQTDSVTDASSLGNTHLHPSMAKIHNYQLTIKKRPYQLPT